MSANVRAVRMKALFRTTYPSPFRNDSAGFTPRSKNEIDISHWIDNLRGVVPAVERFEEGHHERSRSSARDARRLYERRPWRGRVSARVVRISSLRDMGFARGWSARPGVRGHA